MLGRAKKLSIAYFERMIRVAWKIISNKDMILNDFRTG